MLLPGADIAAFIQERHFHSARGLRPRAHMVILEFQASSPSASYIKAKQRYGEEIGATVEYVQLDPKLSTEQATQQLELYNARPEVHGIIVQLPLPEQIDAKRLLNTIAPTKDVDGLGDKAVYSSATATGIMWLLGSHGVVTRGAKVVVIGQGLAAGKPVADMLEAAGAVVSRCDIRTKNLEVITKAAQIIISATGQPGLITRSMVSDGAVIVDAGVGMSKEGGLKGDVDPALYDDPKLKVTPVPGGVGPMTVAALFEHLLVAARKK